jgi:hypothetical protein
MKGMESANEFFRKRGASDRDFKNQVAFSAPMVALTTPSF